MKKKYHSACKARTALEEVLDEPYSRIVQDAAIQRFEFTFEICWKTIQAYLKEGEGIVANSPKSVFREAFSIELITEDETERTLKMVDDRNLTTHTYHEEIANKIYKKLPDYCELLSHLLEQIEDRAL